MRLYSQYSRALALSIAAVVLSCTQDNMEFNAADFERGAGFPMPASARLLKSETRNWDWHKDHDACAVVAVSQADHERIKAALLKAPSAGELPSLTGCSDDMYAEFSRYVVDVRQHEMKEGGFAREVALVKDQPIVLVQLSTW